MDTIYSTLLVWHEKNVAILNTNIINEEKMSAAKDAQYYQDLLTKTKAEIEKGWYGVDAIVLQPLLHRQLRDIFDSDDSKLGNKPAVMAAFLEGAGKFYNKPSGSLFLRQLNDLKYKEDIKLAAKYYPEIAGQFVQRMQESVNVSTAGDNSKIIEDHLTVLNSLVELCNGNPLQVDESKISRPQQRDTKIAEAMKVVATQEENVTTQIMNEEKMSTAKDAQFNKMAKKIFGDEKLVPSDVMNQSVVAMFKTHYNQTDGPERDAVIAVFLEGTTLAMEGVAPSQATARVYRLLEELNQPKYQSDLEKLHQNYPNVANDFTKTMLKHSEPLLKERLQGLVGVTKTISDTIPKAGLEEAQQVQETQQTQDAKKKIREKIKWLYAPELDQRSFDKTESHAAPRAPNSAAQEQAAAQGAFSPAVQKAAQKIGDTIHGELSSTPQSSTKQPTTTQAWGR